MLGEREQSAKHFRGLTQVFGLDPRIAFLAFIVDMMLFGAEVLTFGLLIPVSLAAGIVLGFITYRAQMKWYGDDREAALIKGLIIGLLTAIPTPLPAVVFVPPGILGLVHIGRSSWRRLTLRNQNSK